MSKTVWFYRVATCCINESKRMKRFCKQFIMQTTILNLARPMNHDKKCETKTRLLLDCGSQQSYISKEFV